MTNVAFILVVLSPLSSAQTLNGITQFTNKLVRNIEQQNPSSNFVLSPFSLHSAFSQLLIGAAGRTQSELEASLGVTRTKHLVDQYAQIRRSIPSLKTANIMALNSGFSPAVSFVKFLKDGFATEVKEYDMINDKKRTVAEINLIVASRTNNRILNILSSQDINDSTKMILINAVFFKENWKTAFNPSESFSAKFKSPSEGSIMTKYMNIEMQAKSIETENLNILQLPYDKGATSMIIFLPKKGKASNNIMASVSNFPLKTLSSVRSTNIMIAIPKFKLTYETNLKQEMQRLGIKELFTNNANLTYISNHRVKVSDGIHKAFIEVNEEGTEAAAATALLFGTRSGRGNLKRFFANRPFIFMVYDSVNNIPLFMGKLNNPARSGKGDKTQEVAAQIKQIQTRKTQSIKSRFTNKKIINEKCNIYHQSMGVVLNNINLCKEKANIKGFLLKNKSICLKSQTFYKKFLSNNCGSSWCKYATQNYRGWQRQLTADCKYGQNTQHCIHLSSDIKLTQYLQCSVGNG